MPSKASLVRAVCALCAAMLLVAAPRAGVAGETAAEAGFQDSTESRASVSGSVVDAASGVALEGVTVTLSGPEGADGAQVAPQRQTTDAEGAFGFSDVEAGTYTVRFARTGFRGSAVTDVAVRAGEDRRVDFPLPLVASAEVPPEPEVAPPAETAASSGADDEPPSPLEEFIVTAEKLEDMISVRIDSDQLLNVVGAEDFSKFAAGDVAEVLERVAGVNVVEGQFAIIRGLEDRYSSTTLNGAAVPSPDPDSQSVQLDLFPSEVVGNLSVAKNFSPELPSNSAGGMINVVTHEYPEDVELSFKAGTGWNENAQDEFIKQQGHLDVDRLVNGFDPIGMKDGVPIYPDLEKWREQGFRFVGGNPVGLASEKSGNFFEDLNDVLESDYVGTLGGKRVFGGREFRFKAVISQETDYETAEGTEEQREPAGPLFGEPQIVFNPDFTTSVLPGKLEEAGDLSLGVLGLSEGSYDVTISQKVRQTTGFTAFGFDLDEEGNHKIDASFLYTRLKDEAVEFQQGGTLTGFDYEEVFRGQLDDAIPPTALENVASGSYIGNTIVARQNALSGPSRGALAISSFNQSTSFETDRDLWVAQGNGDHRFDLLPGLHFSWAYNQARTTQDESAIGMNYFFEPCGYSGLVPCEAGVERIGIEDIGAYPPSLEALGPGQFATRRDLLLSANSIAENSDFYRLDADYELEFSESSRFQIAGGVWVENADRNVNSAFLQTPTYSILDDGSCFGVADSVCVNDTPLGLGGVAFNELGFANGNLSGMQETTSEASRDVDAWHLRGKLTLWDAVDMLGGFRREHLNIQSLNDPFVRNPTTGEVLPFLGGPLTFPPRFLFIDRIDNPFTGEITREAVESRGDDFVFNDQLVGTGVTPGPCIGDDGSIPGIQCVDLVDEQQLAQFFNGRIDEDLLLPSAGFNFRPFEGMILRGAWAKTVARPSFRELGYYVTVEPGTDDLIVGNPNLGLSNVESYDGRLEYTFGTRGDLVAVSYFTKTIDNPIEAIILREPSNLEYNGLYQTFFNNPSTADLWGIEGEARLSFGYLEYIDAMAPYAPDWLEYLSIGGNYTYINAEVARTDVEIARAQRFYGVPEGEVALYESLPPTRRLFNQPEWIANADISFDHPDWGVRATLAYFAISDVLDAAGSATLNPDGTTFSYVPDRYVGSYMDLRATLSKTFLLPGSFGEMTLSATAKNLTNSSRKLIYDTTQTNKEIAEQELRYGRDYSFALTFRRRF